MLSIATVTGPGAKTTYGSHSCHSVMAPSFLNFKELRRRSKASFRTERSTDESSEASNNTTPTTGSLTPPSIGAQSDPALNLLKDQLHPPLPTAIPRPQTQPHPYSNGASNRYSVSGMVGLGSPVPGGRGPSLPVSQYSPRITNVADSSWVSGAPGDQFSSRMLTNSRSTKRYSL